MVDLDRADKSAIKIVNIDKINNLSIDVADVDRKANKSSTDTSKV